MDEETIMFIAYVAHEANRAYCESLGDYTQPFWAAAPDWQRKSAMNGVRVHLQNAFATPEDSHAAWLKEKLDDGWTYGPVKDLAIKQHPCCVPYRELPKEIQAKDYIFRGIVRALIDAHQGRVDPVLPRR